MCLDIQCFASSAVDYNKDMGTDNRDTSGYLPPDEWSPIETLFLALLWSSLLLVGNICLLSYFLYQLVTKIDVFFCFFVSLQVTYSFLQFYVAVDFIFVVVFVIAFFFFLANVAKGLMSSWHGKHRCHRSFYPSTNHGNHYFSHRIGQVFVKLHTGIAELFFIQIVLMFEVTFLFSQHDFTKFSLLMN